MLHRDLHDIAPDPLLERKILAKVTRRIMPVLLLGFFISFIDRINLGVLYGPLTREFGLTAASFGLAAGLFYVGYLIFEIPSNLGLVKFGARRWLARILITWGAVTVLLASMQGSTSFYLLRFLLGAAEAGFFPGALFYLTLWYPPRALGKSYLIFEYASTISLAVGSVLSSALLAMHGLGGLKGWQWVFIVEGLPAITLGIYIAISLPERPGKAKWLTSDEKTYLETQLPTSVEPFSKELGKVAIVLRSGIAWAFSCLFFCIIIGFWAITYFLPKIVQERFRVDPIHAGLISAIPWVVGAVAILIVTFTSSKTGDRRWHLLILLGGAGVGLLFSAATSSPVVALIGICFSAAGIQASTPLFWTMPATVFRGTMAAVALAMINSLANTSGLVGPWLLGILTDLTGNSREGLYVMSGFFFVSAVTAFWLSTSVSHRNDMPDTNSAKKALEAL